MTGEQIKDYIINELDSEPRHNCEALAEAINHIAEEVEYDSFALMQLLLENKPIDALHTHSYGFHTANGRSLIEGMQNAYYIKEQTDYVD
jgi:replication initiation and membrane attachment protein DnaB